jgi:hypothetical protein
MPLLTLLVVICVVGVAADFIVGYVPKSTIVTVAIAALLLVYLHA